MVCLTNPISQPIWKFHPFGSPCSVEFAYNREGLQCDIKSLTLHTLCSLQVPNLPHRWHQQWICNTHSPFSCFQKFTGVWGVFLGYTGFL
jgi:hypothetical protein